MRDFPGSRELQPKIWFPIGVGALVLVVVVVAARALSTQAHEQLEGTVRLAAATIQSKITTEIETRVHALVRMADRWEIRGAVPFEEWQTDAANYVRDYPGYQAIGWVDPTLHVRWIMPVEGNEAALGFDLNGEERRRLTLTAARDQRTVMITRPIELVQGGLGFIVYVPIFRGDEFGGFISGVFRIERFLDAVLGPGHLSGFAIAVFEESSRIYGPSARERADEAWAAVATVALPGVSWRVRVSPTPALLAEQASWSSTLALAVGILVAGLLALAVRLAQVARVRVTQVEMFNRDLHHQISERRRAEAALRASEERIRLVVETANDAFIAMDHTGIILEWNGQAERSYGWTREEALGQNVTATILPSRFREAFEQAMARVIEPGEDIVLNRRIEGRAMHRKGYEFPVEFAIVPVRTADGITINSFGRDITERKRAEAELLRAKADAETANRTKGEFLANMSHEIRTPMTAILGYTDLLASPETTEAERSAHVATIRRHGTHLLRIINDILDLSKIEAGKMTVERIACSPIDLVGEVFALLEPAAREKSLRFRIVTASGLPDRILADPTRLRQVLMNLVGNAIKFTAVGEVRLSLALAGATLRFAVEDTGIGLSKEAMTHLFRPFSQADASTARRFGGTGLWTRDLAPACGDARRFPGGRKPSRGWQSVHAGARCESASESEAGA